MKFKIGDKVQYKYDDGDIITGTVIRIEGGKLWCNNLSDEKDKNIENWMPEERLELVSSQIPVKDYTPKVGDVIESNGGGMDLVMPIIKGYIGEVNKNYFYVWQNEFAGGKGKLDPKEKGYKYGWTIARNNPIAWIKVIKRAEEEDIKPEDDFKSYFYNGSINLTPSGEINKSKGTFMNKLTSRLKRLLNKNLQKQYKAGMINEDGSLTDKGRDELEVLNQEKFDAELTEVAEEIINEDK